MVGICYFINVDPQGVRKTSLDKVLPNWQTDPRGRRYAADGLWTQAFAEPDSHQTIAAGLHFLKAGSALSKATEPGRLTSSLREAQYMRDQVSPSFPHDGPVRGALFNREETRVRTWSADNTVRLWDTSLDEGIPLEGRMLEYEVRTATTLDSGGRAKLMRFSEWVLKRKALSELQQHRQPENSNGPTK